MVGIIDYGMGNISSVVNAFEYVGADVLVCNEPSDLRRVDRIVIPGVGAFADCMDALKVKSLLPELQKHVIKLQKPTLGICLGMQVMARIGYEFGKTDGLGWFNAEVKDLKCLESTAQLPNIGWDEITQVYEHCLFEGINNFSDFYLVHSYFMDCEVHGDVIATYKLNQSTVTAAILRNNIFATQFHPEKSQDSGLQLITNFMKWQP